MTLDGYSKVFNAFERCFGVSKHINNVTVDDSRDFIHWQLHEKTQFLKSRFRKDKKIGVSIPSANSNLRSAKGAFEVFVKEGIIESNHSIHSIKLKLNNVQSQL